MTQICIALDGTPIPAAVSSWFDEHRVEWLPVDDDGSEDARVLIVGGFTTVGEAELARLPHIELVVRTGAGYEHIDVELLRRREILLVAPRLSDDAAVPEFVIGSVLALLRQMVEADAAVRTGDWEFRDGVGGRELRGRTFGIVGIGRIGTQVARLALAFGCRVIAWHPWSDRDLPVGVERMARLDELLAEADVISLHCRLDPSTRDLINAEALDRMRPGTILVNTARGAIVDEAAVAAACRSGRLAGAVIDTFRDEPRPNTAPFVDQRNILLSPHIAGMTNESVRRIAAFVGQTCCAYLEKSDLPSQHIVNAPA